MCWRGAKKLTYFQKGCLTKKKWNTCVYVKQNGDIWVPNSRGRIFPLLQCYLPIYGNASREVFREFLKLGHDCFLPYLSKFPPSPLPILGSGLPLRGFEFTFIGRTTFGRTPLDEWSARSRDLCLTKPKTHKWQMSMFPAGFEPKVPLCEWSQIYALDGATTGISPFKVTTC